MSCRPPTFLPTGRFARRGMQSRTMAPIISISGLTKSYASGHVALKGIDLAIEEGEIFALLGPNGAGKTTMISIVCGNVNPSGGTVTVAGHDSIRDYRAARATIGLVPQELSTDAFEKVIDTVRFSRGLFGRARDDAFVEKVLRDLSLWDKRNAKIIELSGGMKRRVMIAKALAHEPRILFLDEPTAGVDVELRRDMWALVRQLRETGVTIILTTHYIEEAEEMADRVGVIDAGRILLVEEKHALMARLGRVEAVLTLAQPLPAIPDSLSRFPLSLDDSGRVLSYRGAGDGADGEVAALVQALVKQEIGFTALDIHESSLEDIFVDLVEKRA